MRSESVSSGESSGGARGTGYMRCSFHANREVEAIGACTSCGRGICDACAVTIQGRMLCRCCVETVPIDSSRKHAEERNLKLKDPASAAAMSMLHGGLGQIWNGEIAKGLLLIAAKVAVLIVAIGLFVNGDWYYAGFNNVSFHKRAAV